MSGGIVWDKRKWKRIYIETLRGVLSRKMAIANYNSISEIDYTIHPEIAADDELKSIILNDCIGV